MSDYHYHLYCSWVLMCSTGFILGVVWMGVLIKLDRRRVERKEQARINLQRKTMEDEQAALQAELFADVKGEITMGHLKCAYCGKMFEVADARSKNAAPTHDYPPPCRSVCVGSKRWMISMKAKCVVEMDAAAVATPKKAKPLPAGPVYLVDEFVFTDDRPWPYFVKRQINGDWWLYYWSKGNKNFVTMRQISEEEMENFKLSALPYCMAHSYLQAYQTPWDGEPT